MTAAPAITMGPTTSQATLLHMRSGGNHDSMLTVCRPIGMGPRPAIPMPQTKILRAAVTIHLTMTTTSGPQTDRGQMTMVLETLIRIVAVTGRQTTTATDQVATHTGQMTLVLATTIHTAAVRDRPAKSTIMGHPVETIMDPETGSTRVLILQHRK